MRRLRTIVALLVTALVFGCPSAAEKPDGEPSPAVKESTDAAPSKETAEAPAPETSPDDTLRTIVLVIDGLQPGDVRPGLAPELCRAAHCPGTTTPDPASHATLYTQARAAMPTQTNPNHVAMMTGEYGARSGLVGNAFYNRTLQQAQRMEDPALIGVPTIFDLFAAEPRGQSPPHPTKKGQSPFSETPSGDGTPRRKVGQSLTAAVFGKEKLRKLFDCTRRGDGCGTSNANPEEIFVTHVAPDILKGSAESPAPEGDDCPADPAASYGVAQDACIMDRVIEIIDRDDPAFVFVNLGRVDFEQHAHGPGSPEADDAIKEADRQVGRLVAHLKEKGLWVRTVLFVLSDHSFSRQSAEAPHVIDLDALFEADRKKRPRAWGTHGGLEQPYSVITGGGAATVVLTDLRADARYLSPANAEALKRMREVALFARQGRPRAGVSEALYRIENPRDKGHTLSEVRPAWRIDSPRLGELLVTAEAGKGDGKPGYVFAQRDSFAARAPGNHGHPGTRHIPFVVVSGGDFVVDQIVEASNPAAINEADDTAALPEQAEVVDVAPTVLWLHGLLPPEANDATALLPMAEGRVLREAFKEGW
ncbi:MAG: alkaline phosphatase family protein, partial [Deltaproteobacteria bacterium]|nr:alkaline phosphatase family protein [Deltaproteobacteria bacterium]